MLTTICFYIMIGLLGVFGLAIVVASIASLVHNTRRDRRIRKYTQNQQIAEDTKKQYTQENTKYIANNGRPVVITQTNRNNNAHVVIGYLPYNRGLHVNQVAQANAGNSAEKPKRQVKNQNKVLSKYSRNSSYEAKHGTPIPKWKVKNYNEYSKYNRYNNKHVYRQK